MFLCVVVVLCVCVLCVWVCRGSFVGMGLYGVGCFGDWVVLCWWVSLGFGLVGFGILGLCSLGCWLVRLGFLVLYFISCFCLFCCWSLGLCKLLFSRFGVQA